MLLPCLLKCCLWACATTPDFPKACNGEQSNGKAEGEGAQAQVRKACPDFPLLCPEAEFSPCSCAWYSRLPIVWSVLELEFFWSQASLSSALAFLWSSFCAQAVPTLSLSPAPLGRPEAGMDLRTQCSQGTVLICFILRAKAFGIFWNEWMQMPSGILRRTPCVENILRGPVYDLHFTTSVGRSIWPQTGNAAF